MFSLRRLLQRRSVWIALGLVGCLLISLLVYTGYTFYYGPVPDTSGARQVAGLDQPVTIYRDAWGVPHIYANSVEDLFLAQGYTHAQERWWQMELTRQLARGQLSQITGLNDTIQQADRFIQTVDWVQSAERDWAAASPETRRVLRAYTDGVNAYIGERNTHDLAMEYNLLALSGEVGNLFALLGQDSPVAAWTPVDSILWTKLLAWQMGGDWWQELENARLYHQLDAPLLDTYLFPQPAESLFEALPPLRTLAQYVQGIQDIEQPQPSLPPDVNFQHEARFLDAPLVGDPSPQMMTLLGLNGPVRGNAWVVGGQRTTSGQPILVNDLQSPPHIPGQWFEMGLHCIQPSAACPYNVVGFSAPGVPGIVAGHNEQVAWGLNPLNTDTQDLYLLTLNPEQPTEYLWEGEWRAMERRMITVRVNEETAWTYPAYYTHFGPVLTDIEAIRGDDLLFAQSYQAVALYWPAHHQTVDWIGAVLRLNRAQNQVAFQAALANWRWPVMNIVYADRDGNAGLFIAGDVPLRARRHTGHVPAPGWTARYQWQGAVPALLLPRFWNVADGLVADHNQPLVPWWYELYLSERLRGTVNLSANWSPDYRAQRLESLMQSRRQQGVDAMGRMQADTHNMWAEALLPYVLALDVSEANLAETIAWLADWNRANDLDSPQAAWFEMFWAELVRHTFSDELGYIPPPDEHHMQVVAQLLDAPDHAWWDDAQTPFTHETRDDILLKSLVRSYNSLLGQLGANRERWRWGDIQQVMLRSRLIGYESVLPLNDVAERPINRGPYALGGGTATLNTMAYALLPPNTEATPAGVLMAPGYRLIVDLSDFNNSRAMHFAGQSGHPASPNYDDMIMPWRTVDYHNMLWGQTIVDQANRRLELQPAPVLTPAPEN